MSERVPEPRDGLPTCRVCGSEDCRGEWLCDKHSPKADVDEDAAAQEIVDERKQAVRDYLAGLGVQWGPELDHLLDVLAAASMVEGLRAVLRGVREQGEIAVGQLEAELAKAEERRR